MVNVMFSPPWYKLSALHLFQCFLGTSPPPFLIDKCEWFGVSFPYFAIVNMVSKYKWCKMHHCKLCKAAWGDPTSSHAIPLLLLCCACSFLVDLGLMQECFFVLICASCGLKESGSRNCAAKCCNASKDHAQAEAQAKQR